MDEIKPNNTEQLKPCPFCGAETEFIIDEDHHGVFYTLGCPEKLCPAHWAYYTVSPEDDMTIKDAISRWNHRVEEVQAPE